MNLPKFQNENLEWRNLFGLLVIIAIVAALAIYFTRKEPKVVAWRNSMLFAVTEGAGNAQYMIEFGFRSDGVLLWRNSGILSTNHEQPQVKR